MTSNFAATGGKLFWQARADSVLSAKEFAMLALREWYRVSGFQKCCWIWQNFANWPHATTNLAGENKYRCRDGARAGIIPGERPRRFRHPKMQNGCPNLPPPVAQMLRAEWPEQRHRPARRICSSGKFTALLLHTFISR
jgi:hypothetical protein